jgi:hypothetical protein
MIKIKSLHYGRIFFVGFILIFFVNKIFAASDAQKIKDCLFLISDTIPYEKYGYLNNKGDTVIPLGKYEICFTDTFCNFAIVQSKGMGFIGIDRNENKLFKIFSFDNGPDQSSDGLFRILSDNKIGFADMSGNIVIKPQFAAVLPFSDGFAAFCSKCQNYQKGEYSYWGKGEWGFIDKNGQVVIQPKFEKVIQSFKSDSAIVVYNGKQVVIDRKGIERK